VLSIFCKCRECSHNKVEAIWVAFEIIEKVNLMLKLSGNIFVSGVFEKFSRDDLKGN
jgi:hypothetical protein